MIRWHATILYRDTGEMKAVEANMEKLADIERLVGNWSDVIHEIVIHKVKTSPATVIDLPVCEVDVMVGSGGHRI